MVLSLFYNNDDDQDDNEKFEQTNVFFKGAKSELVEMDSSRPDTRQGGREDRKVLRTGSQTTSYKILAYLGHADSDHVHLGFGHDCCCSFVGHDQTGRRIRMACVTGRLTHSTREQKRKEILERETTRHETETTTATGSFRGDDDDGGDCRTDESPLSPRRRYHGTSRPRRS